MPHALALAERSNGRTGALSGDQIGAADFERLAALVNRETGIKLPPSKRLMIEGRLRKRMRACNKADISSTRAASRRR